MHISGFLILMNVFLFTGLSFMEAHYLKNSFYAVLFMGIVFGLLTSLICIAMAGLIED